MQFAHFDINITGYEGSEVVIGCTANESCGDCDYGSDEINISCTEGGIDLCSYDSWYWSTANPSWYFSQPVLINGSITSQIDIAYSDGTDPSYPSNNITHYIYLGDYYEDDSDFNTS